MDLEDQELPRADHAAQVVSIACAFHRFYSKWLSKLFTCCGNWPVGDSSKPAKTGVKGLDSVPSLPKFSIERLLFSARWRELMSTEMINKVVADVKCYFCGHVSGQIVGKRHQPLKVTDFIPRPGYQGPEVRPGSRLRCERCQGPVFLEDATNSASVRPASSRKTEARGKSVERRGRKAA